MTVTAPNKSAADKMRRELAQERARTRTVLRPDDPQTMNDLAAAWLRSMEAADYSPVTVEGRVDEWERWCAPHLGGKRISEMSARVVHDWRAELTKRKVPLRTREKALECLRLSLDLARTLGIRQDNPARDAHPRKPKPTAARAARTRTVEVLNKDQVAYLAEHGASGPKHRALLLVLGHTGLRKGEMLALRWSDVKLTKDGGKLHMNRTVRWLSREHRESGGRPQWAEGVGKTPKAKRTIPLTPELEQALRDWNAMTPSAASDWVFPGDERDRPMARRTVNQILDRSLARANAYAAKLGSTRSPA